MKEIKLTQNKIALVDDKDFELLSKYKWCSSNGYAITRVIGGNGKQLRMHQLIMGVSGKQIVDHKDENPLNNLRENLRIATKAQNMRNRGKQKNNTSGYKGVGWDSERGRWKVQLRANRKNIMKRFLELKEAVEFYNQVALKYHSKFARLNTI